MFSTRQGFYKWVQLSAGGGTAGANGYTGLADSFGSTVYSEQNQLQLAGLTNGNLTVNEQGSYSSVGAMQNRLKSGKWYWEIFVNDSTNNTQNIMGVHEGVDIWLNSVWNSYGNCMLYRGGGGVFGYVHGANITVDTTNMLFAPANSTVMFALDIDNGKAWVGKDGTWYNSGVPGSGTNNQYDFANVAGGPTSHTWMPSVQTDNLGTSGNITAIFDSANLTYSAPTGFVAGVPEYEPTFWSSWETSGNLTLSNGDRTVAGTVGTQIFQATATSNKTISKGKYYWEVTWDSHTGGNTAPTLGMWAYADNLVAGTDYTTFGTRALYVQDGNLSANNITTHGTASAWTVGDTIMFALDLDNAYLYTGLNGTWNNSANLTAGTGYSFSGFPLYGYKFAMYTGSDATSADQFTVNFGDRSFTETVPSGYTAGLPVANYPGFPSYVTANLVCYIDPARMECFPGYNGSVFVSNEIYNLWPSPADSEAQSTYDWFNGTTINADPADLGWIQAGTYGDASYLYSTSGAQSMDIKNGASTTSTFIKSLHKASAKYTVEIWMYWTGSNTTSISPCFTNGVYLNGGSDLSGGMLYTDLGNAIVGSGSQHSLRVQQDSGGTSSLSVAADANISANVVHMIACSVDSTGAEASFLYKDGSYDQVSASNTFDGTYSSPSSTDPSYPARFGAPGNNGAPVPTGTRFYLMRIYNTNLTKEQLDQNWESDRYRFGL